MAKAKRRSRRTRNAKGRFIKGHAAASPKRRRRAKRHSAREANLVVVSAPRRKRARKTTRRTRRASPRRARRMRHRRVARRQTVVRVRAARRGRRRISYRTRGRRRQAKAVLIRTQRRGKRRVRVTAIRGRGPHRFALENPLTGAELIIVGVTGVVGATAGSLVDRFLATHALTVPANQGGAVTTDAPDAAKMQLYNYQAVSAPMGWQRWLAGVGGSAAFLAVGGYVKSPGWRATWQGFGIGWGLQVLVKGATDLMTMIFGKVAFGERLYANEISAANAAKNAKAAGYAVVPVPVVGLAAPQKQTAAATTSCSACSRQNAVGVGCPCTAKGVTQAQANAAAKNPVVRHPAPALQPAPETGVAGAPTQQQAVSVKAPSWRSRQPVMAAYR